MASNVILSARTGMPPIAQARRTATVSTATIVRLSALMALAARSARRIARKLIARLHPNSASRRVPKAVSPSAGFMAVRAAPAAASAAQADFAGRRIGS